MNEARIAEVVTLVEQAETIFQAGNNVEAVLRLEVAMPTIRQAFAQAVAQPARPAPIARGRQQLGADTWASAWESGRPMYAATLLAAVEGYA